MNHVEIKKDKKEVKPSYHSQLRFDLACSQCYRRYVQPIPIPAKNNVVIIPCPVCEIVLARFDWGTQLYSEEHILDKPEDTI